MITFLMVLFMYVVPIILVVISMDKNEYFFGFLFCLYNIIMKMIFKVVIFSIAPAFIISFIISYVIAVLSLKVASKLSHDSKILYVSFFEGFYNLLYAIIISVLV